MGLCYIAVVSAMMTPCPRCLSSSLRNESPAVTFQNLVNNGESATTQPAATAKRCRTVRCSIRKTCQPDTDGNRIVKCASALESPVLSLSIPPYA